MVDFKSLKKKSSASLEKLTKAVEALNESNGNPQDDKFWQPDVDKSGNGYAVIRFLPASAADGDDALPWVKIFSHGFQGPGGKWYIENSRTTLGDKDPVSEYNSELWNSGIEANKDLARKQKRKLSYISNILVVEDSKHPENEGKVFLYRYGKIIFDKITGAMNPEFEDEEPFNPFDFWEGANFKLKIRKVDGYRNYDKCEFSKPTPIADDDDALEAIWKSEHALSVLLEASNFKPYDQLKARFESVIGLTGAASAPTTVEKARTEEKKKGGKKIIAEDAPEPVVVATEEEDDVAYFSRLAEED